MLNLSLLLYDRDIATLGSGAEAAAHLGITPSGDALAVVLRNRAILAVALDSGRITHRGSLPPPAGDPIVGGPALVVGDSGRYLLANYVAESHGPQLWVSDLAEDRHWPVGAAAHHLLRLDGQVWGVAATGEAAPEAAGDKEQRGWRPPFGHLFRYSPGTEHIEEFAEVGLVSLAAPVPGRDNCLFLAHRERLSLYDTEQQVELASTLLAGPPLAAAVNYQRDVAWFTLPGSTLYGCSLLADDEISAIIVGDRFGPAGRGFFCLPESGWLAGVASDGTVSVFDPDTQRVRRIPGPPPGAAGPSVIPESSSWCYAGERVTVYTLDVAAATPAEAFRRDQEEMTAGSLRLTAFHESMRMLLRRDDQPAFKSEVMCPESVDPRGPEHTAGPPRLAWNRSMQGVYWQRAADGWFELRETFPDFGYLSRVRLNPDGLRLDMALTATNRSAQAFRSVHFSPCAGLSGDLVDLRHRRTYVVTSDGRLTLLGPLVEEFPYVAVSVRGAPERQHSPDMPKAFRFADLQLDETVIIVRALDGRGSLVMGFENADSIAALFVPCVHCETFVENVPAGGSATVRGFVGWVPGDERDGYGYYRAWKNVRE